ncbi:MAG TPA: hypothetical protein VK675_04870 [Candidatus Paceibacterota bacterium]|nr:hypothetical protein [Candidatus Paceibacterota bacterium]
MKLETYNVAPGKKEDLPTQQETVNVTENSKINSSEETSLQREKVEAVRSFDETKDNEELNPEMELGIVSKKAEKNAAEIARLSEVVSRDREKLVQIYEKLGMPIAETDSVDAKNLQSLLEEKNKLEEQKQKAETVEGLNEVLEKLNNLSKSELKIIIETGRDSAGKQIQGENGKLEPDVAKKLATLAEEGVKKITKAALNIIAGMVKGFLKAVFRVEESGEGQ